VVRSVVFSPNGKVLATAGYEPDVTLRDVASGQVVGILHGHERGVNAVAFAPDGQSIATAGLDGTVKVWDAASGRLKSSLGSGQSGSLYSVAWSPDGRRLLSAGEDRKARYWGAESGELLRTLSGHRGGIESVAFAPGGNIAATASWDKTIMLWDLASGGEIATLEGHREPVLGVAFSPDGKVLATCSGTWGSIDVRPGKGELKLWNVEARAERFSLRRDERIFSVTFSPDGRTLAAASWDGTVNVWGVESFEDVPGTRGNRLPDLLPRDRPAIEQPQGASLAPSIPSGRAAGERFFDRAIGLFY
jgi:WD40 repeat protein